MAEEYFSLLDGADLITSSHGVFGFLTSQDVYHFSLSCKSNLELARPERLWRFPNFVFTDTNCNMDFCQSKIDFFYLARVRLAANTNVAWFEEVCELLINAQQATNVERPILLKGLEVGVTTSNKEHIIRLLQAIQNLEELQLDMDVCVAQNPMVNLPMERARRGEDLEEPVAFVYQDVFDAAPTNITTYTKIENIL
tara:strand:- start:897 stop:1487 length:591 start_codon:yes stop_codon:yes gene_type:complete